MHQIPSSRDQITSKTVSRESVPKRNWREEIKKKKKINSQTGDDVMVSARKRGSTRWPRGALKRLMQVFGPIAKSALMVALLPYHSIKGEFFSPSLPCPICIITPLPGMQINDISVITVIIPCASGLKHWCGSGEAVLQILILEHRRGRKNILLNYTS